MEEMEAVTEVEVEEAEVVKVEAVAVAEVEAMVEAEVEDGAQQTTRLRLRRGCRRLGVGTVASATGGVGVRQCRHRSPCSSSRHHRSRRHHRRSSSRGGRR